MYGMAEYLMIMYELEKVRREQKRQTGTDAFSSEGLYGQ